MKRYILPGDCLAVLPMLPDDSVDSCVTDPPYHLTSIVKRFGAANAAPAQFGKDGAFKRASAGFMGKQWDGGDVAFRPETWAEVFRVMKPGAHLLAFGGTRTFHRMTCAIEDAGFEIRDTLMWIYASGFPKSHDVAKGIDKAAGVERKVVGKTRGGVAPSGGYGANGMPSLEENEKWHDVTAPATDAARQWQGWGTALKPAQEPVVMARKPLIGTVAENVLAYGMGAINIDACRVGEEVRLASYTSFGPCHGNQLGAPGTAEARRGTQGDAKEYVGRWPANVIHDGSEEVLAAFPDAKGQQGALTGKEAPKQGTAVYGDYGPRPPSKPRNDSGSAARYFYCAKASKADRNEGVGKNTHPTVKPESLMRYLCRLVTPPGGTVLDPFAGSGSTGKGAVLEGLDFIGIEREAEYVSIAEARIAAAVALAIEELCA